MNTKLYVIVIIAVLLFAACGGQSLSQPAHTATPLPLTATGTNTPMPTATATATLTATPDKGIQNPENGHWYLVLPVMSWDNARNDCTSRGGHLTTIENDAENLFIYNLASRPFLGGTDRDNEGHWVWAAGEEMSYTNWCIGEPNNRGGDGAPEHYLTYHDDPKCIPGQWNDVASDEGVFVCEFED